MFFIFCQRTKISINNNIVCYFSKFTVVPRLLFRVFELDLNFYVLICEVVPRLMVNRAMPSLFWQMIGFSVYICVVLMNKTLLYLKKPVKALIILTFQPRNVSYRSLQGSQLNKIKLTKYLTYAEINTAIIIIVSFYSRL